MLKMIDLIKNHKLLIFCTLLTVYIGILKYQSRERLIEFEKAKSERDIALNIISSLSRESEQYKEKISYLNKYAKEEHFKALNEAKKLMKQEVPLKCEKAVEWAKEQAIKGL